MPVLSTLGAAIANVYGFTSGLIKDQYFNLVSLLLPGNGTNGAQNNTFLDSSSNTFTITRNGNTTQGTFSPFSHTGWGGYFNGSSSLTPSSGSFLALGTSNYTIEFWIYLTQNVGNNHVLAINANNGLVVVIGATKTSLNQYGVGDLVATGSGLSINTWHHVAIVREGTGSNQTSIYIDGSRSVQGTDATNWTVTTNPRIGGNTTDQYIYGYISNVRVVTSAIYSGASITVPTSPLTDISGTTFRTLQNNRFLDNGSTAATFTTTGSPSVVPFSPFAPTQSYSAAAVGGSGYFDGTGDYLQVAANTNLNFGTGNFTVESWVYTGSTGTLYFAIGDSTGDVFFGYEGGNFIIGRRGIANDVATSGFTMPQNQWAHVVFTRAGTGTNQTRIFVNGVLRGVGTTAQSYNFTTNIGIAGGTFGSWPGYFTNLRFVKGSVVSAYSTSSTTVGDVIFTPPTAPLTAITDTQLLLNFTNAGVVDATAKNVLETVGNAQISTTQSKWGGGSIAFDGTGDAGVIQDSPVNRIGGGKYVIEFWYYAITLPTVTYILCKTGATGTTADWAFYTTSSTTLRFGDNTSSANTITGTIASGSWQHIAASWDGTTARLYVNGTLQSSSTNSLFNNFTSTQPIIVGASTNAGANGINGYLDDVRITRGSDRGYTGSTITVPTAPFPLQ